MVTTTTTATETSSNTATNDNDIEALDGSDSGDSSGNSTDNNTNSITNNSNTRSNNNNNNAFMFNYGGDNDNELFSFCEYLERQSEKDFHDRFRSGNELLSLKVILI